MNEKFKELYGASISEDQIISNRKYNIMIGLHLIYGIILTAAMSIIFGKMMTGMYFAHPIVFTIGFFAISIYGSRIAASLSYGKALMGYTITVLAFGGLVATVIPFYSAEMILTAAGLTLIILITMTTAAVLMPNAFLGLGRTIFVALIGLIIAELVSSLFGFYNVTLFGVLGIFLFSLYLGYDWSRGQQYPKTAGFAVLASLSLYMDIINIFMRVLSIMGRRSD